MPALILSGDLDPVTPPRWGEAMKTHFPGARHIVVPGAGHNTSMTGCVPDLIAGFIAAGNAGGLDAACVQEGPPAAVRDRRRGHGTLKDALKDALRR